MTPLINVELNESFDSALVTLKYDASAAGDPSNYTLAYFNESLAYYVPVSTCVDTINHTLSATLTHFCLVAGFDGNALQNIYDSSASFNAEHANSTSPGSGMEVYLAGRSQSWPYDMRFASTGNVPLSYWIESYDDNNATVWVKVPQISAYQGTSTIDMYYGKAGDGGASDGAGTFVAFYDFSTNRMALFRENGDV